MHDSSADRGCTAGRELTGHDGTFFDGFCERPLAVRREIREMRTPGSFLLQSMVGRVRAAVEPEVKREEIPEALESNDYSATISPVKK